jgi:hypothetical protein
MRKQGNEAVEWTMKNVEPWKSRLKSPDGLSLIELTVIVAMVWVCAALAVSLIRHMNETSEVTIGPDGKPALLISCSNSADCIRDAAKSCPNGYSLASQQQEKGSSTVFVGGGDAPLVPLTNQTWEGSMLIRCRAEKAAP